MVATATLDCLNDLLHLQYCSLVRFLNYGSPFEPPGDGELVEAIRRINRDQEQMSQRVAHLILARGGNPEPGDFLIQFAELHFLSLDYILRELIHYQRGDVAEIAALVEELGDDPDARALAEETLGQEKAHLDELLKFTKKS